MAFPRGSFLEDFSPRLRACFLRRRGLFLRSMDSVPRRATRAWLRAHGGSSAEGLDSEGVRRGALDPSWVYLGRHGKLLRPLLASIVLEAFGRRPESFLPLLGMIECQEAATCSFDDVVDDSQLRRGGPSTHELHGIPLAFAAYQALYNASWSAVFDPSMPLSAEVRLAVLDALAREILAYGLGQCQELRWSRERRLVSAERYLQMSSDRIVFMSFNGPMRIGALVGGCAGARLKALVEFGTWLGMGYHLHGDELNLFPRSGDWGKAVADDVPSGRVTVLYREAWRRSSPAARRILLKPFGDPRARDSDVRAALEVVRGSGAVECNRRWIGTFRARAARALRRARLPAAGGALLSDMLRFMTETRRM